MTYSVEQWIADLRSGEFKQGSGQLFNTENNSYCCLGVAAQGMGYDKTYEEPCDCGCGNEDGESLSGFKWQDHTGLFNHVQNTELPDNGTFWVGMEDRDTVERIFDYDLMEDLASKNDGNVYDHSNKFSFSEIADYIEDIWNNSPKRYEETS